MDVSNPELPDGEKLIETVVSLTELPEEDLVYQEVQQMLRDNGKEPGTATLDCLREALLAYLETIQMEYQAAQDAAGDPPDEDASKSGTQQRNGNERLTLVIE